MKFNITKVDGVPVLLPPPSGYVVDLDHPTQQHDLTAYIVFGIGFPLSTFFFAQYIYVKLRLLRKVDIQLVCVASGWVFSIAMQAILIANFKNALIGVHGWELPVTHAQRQARDLVITTALNAIVTGFCKVSLVLFYLHLSPQTWWKWTSWSALFLMAGYNAAVFFAIMFGCVPIEKNWTHDMPGHCINRPKLYIARAALGVFSDLLLLVMPIPLITGLKMPTRQKLGLVAFFCIGSVTCFTAAVRCYLLIPTLNSDDITWTVSSTAVVILAESHLLVICATLPTLRQFFAHLSPHLIGERGSSAKKSQSTAPELQSFSFKTIGNISNRKKFDQFGMTVDEENISLHPVKTDHPNNSASSVNTNNSHGLQKKVNKYGMTIYEESSSTEMFEAASRNPRHFNTTDSRGIRKMVDKYGMTMYQEDGLDPSAMQENTNLRRNASGRRKNEKMFDEYGLTIHEDTFCPPEVQQPSYVHPPPSHPPPRPPRPDYNYLNQTKMDNYGAPPYEEPYQHPARVSEYAPSPLTSSFNPGSRKKKEKYMNRMAIQEEDSYPPAMDEKGNYMHQGFAEYSHGQQNRIDSFAAPAYDEKYYPRAINTDHSLIPVRNLINRGRANMRDEFGWTKYEEDFYPQTPASPERPSEFYMAIESSLSPRPFRMTGDDESFGTFGKADQSQDDLSIQDRLMEDPRNYYLQQDPPRPVRFSREIIQRPIKEQPVQEQPVEEQLLPLRYSRGDPRHYLQDDPKPKRYSRDDPRDYHIQHDPRSQGQVREDPRHYQEQQEDPWAQGHSREEIRRHHTHNDLRAQARAQEPIRHQRTQGDLRAQGRTRDEPRHRIQDDPRLQGRIARQNRQQEEQRPQARVQDEIRQPPIQNEPRHQARIQDDAQPHRIQPNNQLRAQIQEDISPIRTQYIQRPEHLDRRGAQTPDSDDDEHGGTFFLDSPSRSSGFTPRNNLDSNFF